MVVSAGRFTPTSTEKNNPERAKKRRMDCILRLQRPVHPSFSGATETIPIVGMVVGSQIVCRDRPEYDRRASSQRRTTASAAITVKSSKFLDDTLSATST
jgi:hypothetical protein